jgi:ParB-like chromosome segregation protein Spo0J
MQMQTKRMLLRDIRPAAYNPRKRLEPGEKEYEALKGSIERWGLVDPLVVNARTGNLISGHQRYYILTNLGETETEAVAVDLDERQEKLLNVAMNKVEGQWDYGKLETLLSEFETDEILFTGFSEGEIATLFGEEADDVVEEYEDADTGDEENEDESGSDDDGEFSIYLSFPDRDAAMDWLAEHELEKEFPKGSRNMVVHMEGTTYGN